MVSFNESLNDFEAGMRSAAILEDAFSLGQTDSHHSYNQDSAQKKATSEPKPLKLSYWKFFTVERIFGAESIKSRAPELSVDRDSTFEPGQPSEQ